MKYVVLYASADDVAHRAPPHFPAHKERLDAFHARGDLLMVGTFARVCANPGDHGRTSGRRDARRAPPSLIAKFGA